MQARAQTIVAQRYALHERVGQGGCGVVYRATDQTSGETVAVKMLSRAARQNPSFVERLVREQQALLALAGTHAVAAIDLCRADTGELCLVMEWLEGADLEQHLSTREQSGTRFAVDELLQVMRPVLETFRCSSTAPSSASVCQPSATARGSGGSRKGKSSIRPSPSDNIRRITPASAARRISGSV